MQEEKTVRHDNICLIHYKKNLCINILSHKKDESEKKNKTNKVTIMNSRIAALHLI